MPYVYRLYRRLLPTREDAEDATTEIFLKTRLKLSQFDGARPFRPWLTRVAANHCRDELRKRRPGPVAIEETISEIEASNPSPSELLLDGEKRAQVRKALRSLDDRGRLALGLRYYGELRYDEIADILGISRSLVGVLLLRSRHRLRHALEDADPP